MKSKLALIFAGTTLVLTNAVAPAIAYESHEHSFHSSSRIQSMTQTEGNGYCKQVFTQLKSTGDLGGGFDPSRVTHVWAHIQNGHCVANT